MPFLYLYHLILNVLSRAFHQVHAWGWPAASLGSPGILMTKTDAGALPKPRNSSSEAMRSDGTRVGSRHPCEAAACLPDVPEAWRREEVRREVRGWDQQD